MKIENKEFTVYMLLFSGIISGNIVIYKCAVNKREQLGYIEWPSTRISSKSSSSSRYQYKTVLIGVSASSYSEYDAHLHMTVLKKKTCEGILHAEIHTFRPAVLTGKNIAH